MNTNTGKTDTPSKMENALNWRQKEMEMKLSSVRLYSKEDFQ